MKAKSSPVLFVLFLLIGSGFLVACSSSVVRNNSLMARLKNRGPVALSPNNPYLAPNLLLAKEMERSPDLKGFIEHSGQPNALQIDDGMLTSATMRLYYTGKNQYFVLEDLNGTWIINGPYDASTNELAGLPTAGQTEGDTIQSSAAQGDPTQHGLLQADSVKPASAQPEFEQPAPAEFAQADTHQIVPFRSMASSAPTPTFEAQPTKLPKREKESRTPPPKTAKAASAPTRGSTTLRRVTLRSAQDRTSRAGRSHIGGWREAPRGDRPRRRCRNRESSDRGHR